MSIFPNSKSKPIKDQAKGFSILTTQVVGIVLATLGILGLLSMATFSPADQILFVDHSSSNSVPENAVGPIGATLAFSLLTVVGGGAYVVPLLLVMLGLSVLWGEKIRMTSGSLFGSLIGVLSVSALLHLQFSAGPQLSGMDVLGVGQGGVVGQWVAVGLGSYLAVTGATIMLVALLLIAFLLLVPVSIGQVARTTLNLGVRLKNTMVESVKERDWWASDAQPKMNKSIRINRQLAARGGIGTTVLEAVESKSKLSKVNRDDLPATIEIVPTLPLIEEVDDTFISRRQISKSYQMPSPVDLLDTHAVRAAHQTDAVLKSQSEVLVNTLASFGIEGGVTDVHPGPVITMYEFAPGPGIKVARIVNLADDLAMALKALKVRVVAPLPGKSTVGIEVPNPQRETVGLKEMLTSEAFTRARSKLALALGKDIFGRPVVTDLRTMPHLLVAGATGSGKSVGLNCLLLNILFTAHPDEVKLLLIDPKVLELQVYDGIPHLIRPVITNPKEAARGLGWVVQEMERRYQVLAELGVRNIDAYNKKVTDSQEAGSPLLTVKKLSKGQSMNVEEGAPLLESSQEERVLLPYIVVVIDEFADLIMVAPKDIEDRIARLAQMARASGIHLVLATQRPSVDVVTGLIKANFPARIAYQVSSKIDSRTILDANGAESLLGKGDMLFLSSGTGGINRLHGPYVSDEEVRGVVEWVKSQATPIYDPVALESVQEPSVDEQERDETYERARELVMTTGQASASFIQRRLRVGYPRAARMIEQMEEEGLVSAPGRDGRREVLARSTAIAEIG
ncbi:DNA translocase FtsK 4TM domain-containing protein [uncultured Nitrospira sp.]|uniref:FtsK/SpoIIIE family DNA translocase n=1 Tax=uncultured Nitrospira sp. TaxID=157176 RepID=UPI0031406E29